MSDENADVVRRFYEEVWVRGNLDVADEVFADDYIRHDSRGFEDGKVAEIWNHRDDLGLMEQLGARIFAGADPE